MANEKMVKVMGEKEAERLKEEAKTPKKKRTTKKKSDTKKEDVKEETVVDYEETEIPEEKKKLVGDEECYLYFYLRATNEGNDADIIDISIISNVLDSDNKPLSLYCQFSDYDIKKVTGSVFESAIKTLPKEGDVVGTRSEIGFAIYEFILANFIVREKFVQFLTSCNVYEFGHLKTLLKETGKDLSFMSPIVGDINQDLATSFFTVEKPGANYVPLFVAASSITKEKAFEVMYKDCDKELSDISSEENPSMKNAKIFRMIHRKLWGLN